MRKTVEIIDFVSKNKVEVRWNFRHGSRGSSKFEGFFLLPFQEKKLRKATKV